MPCPHGAPIAGLRGTRAKGVARGRTAASFPSLGNGREKMALLILAIGVVLIAPPVDTGGLTHAKS